MLDFSEVAFWLILCTLKPDLPLDALLSAQIYGKSVLLYHLFKNTLLRDGERKRGGNGLYMAGFEPMNSRSHGMRLTIGQLPLPQGFNG